MLRVNGLWLRSRRRGKKLLTALLCLMVPRALKPFFLRLLGHRIGSSCKIGCSILWTDKLYLGDRACIGYFNFIHCRRVILLEKSSILHMNEVRGPMSLYFAPTASLGNRNKVRRAAAGVSVGPSVLRLGVLSKITANHTIDCMCSIEFGNYSTLAGAGSQIWTHGYVHHRSGPERYRVDGPVRIGNNVYIGSASIVSMGLFIADSVVVGSASSVSKSITEQGLYVSQPLRRVDYEPEEVAARLDLRVNDGLVEEVYVKKLPPRTL